MKNVKTKLLLVAIALLCNANIFAQSLNDYIDVVYLKNGSLIKGIIIEQVPGKSLKIETSDGSQFVYQIAEVEKFTRELKPVVAGATAAAGTKMPATKREPKPFYSKQKGYFGGVELLIAGSPGLRIINGYKFGRFGYLGIAVGIEGNRTNNYNYYDSYGPYMGGMFGDRNPYATLNIVYGGDILKRRITPFYQIEAGYGFNLQNRSDRYYSYYDNLGNYYDYIYQQRNLGGPMGGAVFGVKFNTSKKVNFKLGLSARWFSNISDPVNTNISLPYPQYNYGSSFDMSGSVGLRFGIGF